MTAPEAEMTVMDHLRELRSRIIRSILAVGAGMMGLLAFYDPVKEFLTRPYVRLCASAARYGCDGSLYSLGPLDGFTARLRISTYGGVVVALPVILWQVWRFVSPGLEKKEKRYAVPFIASSVVLFAAGVSIAYWTLDKALEFLINWSGTEITEAYRITDYIMLVVMMMLAFGIGFLSPVLLVFLQLFLAIRRPIWARMRNLF